MGIPIYLHIMWDLVDVILWCIWGHYHGACVEEQGVFSACIAIVAVVGILVICVAALRACGEFCKMLGEMDGAHLPEFEGCRGDEKAMRKRAFENALKRYVSVELVYDICQMAFVSAWVEKLFTMKEGCDDPGLLYWLNLFTSAADFFFLKGPEAFKQACYKGDFDLCPGS
eukprot:CAMPEP_0171204400 /NCGR_PEP_ID=MMETSP0790-20130122/26023_1 /TAXON_ID=2925 /ORGANISM="Alexandrium catenella, Strain OF101" /LENGTH=170 /DNA_ID=CAMNT_0011669903 /DNA_START=31 /DNA_END=543 /DNA_ORIENTATION=-